MKLATCIALLLVLVIEGSVASYKTVCYHGSWAQYRNDKGNFTTNDIDHNLCTHLVYAFAGLDKDDFTVKILDPWLNEDDSLGDFRRFTNIKQKNPKLKTLIGIGGWDEGSEKYSRMVSNDRNREIFVDSVMKFIRQYNFDGLSMDWLYPTNRGGVPADKRNFVKLLKKLRKAFKERGFVLGISVGQTAEIINSAYDVQDVTKLADYVNVLTYDYHEGWDDKTGSNAPLFPKQRESDRDKTLNQDATISLLLEKGADARKLLLSIPTFGKTFELRDPTRNNIGDPAGGPGNPGPYTKKAGLLGYNEIVEKLCMESGWEVNFDHEQKVPFARNGISWISYDNPESVSHKAKYVVDKKLGGVMVWSLDTDDFQGIGKEGTFPLIKTVKRVLETGRIDSRDHISPIRPTAEPSGICLKEGTMSYPGDFTKFITCVRMSGANEFQAVVQKCPAGLAYDENLLSCNWFNEVPRRY